MTFDGRYITKKKLYETITHKIIECGFKLSEASNDNAAYRINSVGLAHEVCHNLHLEYLNFEEEKICGILYKTPKSTSIALNKRRSNEGKNFDCMHELIHYWFHSRNYFYCNEASFSEHTLNNLEWHANEGAAQFLMPYQLFIPYYIHLCQRFEHRPFGHHHIIDTLSKSYGVSQQVVKLRIENLKFEIYQYLHSVPIKAIQILSNQKQKTYGFNDLVLDSSYCKICHAKLHLPSNFCPICGQGLNSSVPLHQRTILKGIGFMIYKGIKTDAEGKALVCPQCNNEETAMGRYCKICGLYLFNICFKPNGDANSIHQNEHYCGLPCEGNARFCPECGGITSFYYGHLLPSWDSVKN